MSPIFFETQADLRIWYEENYDKHKELLMGFYKVGSGKTSIPYKDALDVALCFGWIDAVRRSLDDKSYLQRFTPRTKRSIWSQVNIKRVNELIELGLMHPAGLEAFEKRDEKYMNRYSGEQNNIQLSDEFEGKFKTNEKAWNFFQSQPNSYKKPALWWVISAKQEETRMKRLNTLIKDSEAGLRIAMLRRSAKPV